MAWDCGKLGLKPYPYVSWVPNDKRLEYGIGRGGSGTLRVERGDAVWA